MQVYQLIAELMKVHAGAEVVVGLTSTLNTAIENVEFCIAGDELIITGGDAEVVDSEGEIAGTISELLEQE